MALPNPSLSPRATHRRDGQGRLPAGLALAGLLLNPVAITAAAQAQPAAPVDTIPASSAPAAPNPWAGTLELYGFLPVRTTGSTTVNGFTADTDLWLGQLIPLLQMAASARGSLEQGRYGLLADLSYTRLGDTLARTTSRGLLSGKATVTNNLGIYDIAARYRFGSRESAVAAAGTWSVIPYAGLRLLDVGLGVDAEIRGNGPRHLRLQREGWIGKTWAQPLLGTQATLFLSHRLRAFGRADIGGFGLAGSRDLSGNAQLGLGYAVGNSTDLNISWRYMGLAYDNGAPRASGFSSYQNGVEVGLKFFF